MNSKDTLTFPALKNRLSTKEIENQKQLFLDKNFCALFKFSLKVLEPFFGQCFNNVGCYFND